MKIVWRYWPILGASAVTLTISLGWTSDGVNTPKLLVLGIVAGFALAEVILAIRKSRKILLTPIFVASQFFLLSLFIPLFFAKSPTSQQIYGSAGRNLGFLHYFFLTLVIVGVARSCSQVILPQLLKALFYLGLFESIYGLMQFLEIDPVNWNNPNRWIIGTFGNPNYLSSFIALSAIVTVYFLKIEKRGWNKLVYLAFFVFQFVVIWISEASQGLFLLSFGIFAVLTIFLFEHSRAIGWATIILGTLLACVTLMGIFQKGPFRKYLFQDSVSYRGDYWRAGLNMFRSNWQHGVGLDSYGDFYRMYRDSTSAQRRGLDLVSNSAHNLLIDLASTGGVILLIAYLTTLALVALSIISTFKNTPIVGLDYKILVILWLAFNMQTFISINVSSLAIWGWIFSGVILAFNQSKLSNGNSRKIRNMRGLDTPNFIAFASCFICLILVVPLFSRDVRFSNALKTNNQALITRTVLDFPKDAELMARVAIAYEKLGNDRESLRIAKSAISENSYSFKAWKLILESPISSVQDKRNARAVLYNLDPFYKYP